MQQLLRSEFESTTLVTIAHRLQTIIDYDTIFVLSRGKLVEHGSPTTLLKMEGGALKSMAVALGAEGEAALRERAAAGAGRQVQRA